MPSQAEYFKEIADAIRTKEGSTNSIIAKEFASRILELTSMPIYTITVQNLVPEAGDVTGNGQYEKNMIVSLTFNENPLYKFLGWEENGEIVSKDNPYKFSALADRTIMVKTELRRGIIAIENAAPLSVARTTEGASIKNQLIIFLAGYAASASNAIDVYDSNLIHSVPSITATKRNGHAGVSVGDKYALFGGGLNGTTYYATVEAYDSTITRTVPTALSYKTTAPSRASVGDYGIFAGGLYTNYSSSSKPTTYRATVNAYDISLTKTNPTSLTAARSSIASISADDIAIFAGGNYVSSTNVWTYYTYVDSYDKSLTLTKLDNLSIKRNDGAGATVNGYYLIAGGYTGSGYTNTVDCYDSSLTKSTPLSLSEAKREMTSASFQDYCLFAGGYNSNVTNYTFNTVEYFDRSLTRKLSTPLTNLMYNGTAATINNYALITGGTVRENNAYVRKDTVWVYEAS